MPRFQYGQTQIEWRFQCAPELKRHYVTVERGRPTLLRGPMLEPAEQEALVRRRARWIRDKMTLVNQPLSVDAVVTGSRLRYAGRTYFTEVRHVADLDVTRLWFTASRFVIEHTDGTAIETHQLAPLLEEFYRQRAQEKLPTRVRYWERQTGLTAQAVRIRHFQSRWASCNARNVLEFHPRVMELPPSVQDYVIVHELCHTVEKSHTRAFWQEVARHLPQWRKQHELLERGVFGDSI